MFAWTKISDVGASHPVNARIAIGLTEILRSTELTQHKKEIIKELLHELSLEMIEAEKRGSKLVAEIVAVYKRNIAAFGNSNKLPSAYESALSLNDALVFLKNGKGCLRKIAFILSVIFDLKSENEQSKINRCKDGRYDLIEMYLAEKLPEDHSLLQCLKVYKGWYDLLNQLRNNDEHPKEPLSTYNNFKLNEMGELIKPHFIHPKHIVPIDEFIEISLQYIFSFAETIILLALEECLPDYLVIIEIAEEKRNSQCPKRFKVVPMGHAVVTYSNCDVKP